MNPSILFMQNRAPSYTAAATINKLIEWGVITIIWPLYSPDLNPIETVQNWIKDYIENKYRDVQYSYNKLRAYIKEVQNQITEEQLNSLINSIRKRYQAVIDAEGGFIKF